MPVSQFYKFYAFSEHLAEGVHNLGSDTLKVALTNTAPSLSNSVLADITQIANGGGYTAGGYTLTLVSSSQASGLYKLILQDETITASGGSIGPWRYPVIYNDTPSSPLKPLIGFYDYGSSLTMQDGEEFLLDLDGTGGLINFGG